MTTILIVIVELPQIIILSKGRKGLRGGMGFSFGGV
jgi:hypothetical protein